VPKAFGEFPMPAKQQILCIEDDRDTAELLAEDLAERGFDVVLAQDAASGYSAMTGSAPPDLVVCDISSSEPSGMDLLRKLHGPAAGPVRTPFIYVARRTERAHELEARQLGADDFITKPFDFDILGAIIEARLRSSARALSPGADAQALTPLQARILAEAALGRNAAQIARSVGVGLGAVTDFLARAGVHSGAFADAGTTPGGGADGA
jgi:DNA-binding response OmpR family regulator